MISADILQTIFEVRGVSAVIGAINQAANATDRLRSAQARANAVTAQTSNVAAISAYTSLSVAQRNAAQSAFQSAVIGAQQTFNAVSRIIGVVQKAIGSYEEFTTQVRTFQQLSGGTAQESAFAVNLGKAAGINDTQQLREILRLTKDFAGGAGSAALLRLGITGSGQDTAKTLDMVIEKLQGMSDGLVKTKAMEDAFGMRGVIALQPLLNMTREQRQEVLQLSSAYSGDAFASMQRFEVSSRLLGMTLEQRIIYPMAQQLIPVLQTVVGWIGTAVGWFTSLNTILHGTLTGVILIVGAFGAFGLVAANILTVITAVGELIAILKTLALTQAVVDALMGPLGWAALAAAGIAVVGFGINSAINGDHRNAVTSNTDAINRNTEAVQNLRDNFGQYGGAFPRDMSEVNIARLQRQAALGAIG